MRKIQTPKRKTIDHGAVFRSELPHRRFSAGIFSIRAPRKIWEGRHTTWKQLQNQRRPKWPPRSDLPCTAATNPPKGLGEFCQYPQRLDEFHQPCRAACTAAIL